MCSPSALRPENSFSLASEPITATRARCIWSSMIVEASLIQLERADIKHVGIVAGNRPGENPRVVLDVGLLADFGGDAA